MLVRFFKNHFWIEQGTETLWMAWYLEYFQNSFAAHDHLWIDSMFGHLDDPWVPMILTAIGIFALIVGIWDLHRFCARQVMVGSLQFVWTLFAVAFVWHDIQVGMLGWMTGISIIVCIRIFVNYIKPTFHGKMLENEIKLVNGGDKRE
ncbi:hypothetical protein [Furfurilactobacillus cerevisiae]|uniref:hypothetical protein n=1 Tax=Furfurilactobacillus rossiae TaxID=231049 RepID=UPI003B984E5B